MLRAGISCAPESLAWMRERVCSSVEGTDLFDTYLTHAWIPAAKMFPKAKEALWCLT